MFVAWHVRGSEQSEVKVLIVNVKVVKSFFSFMCDLVLMMVAGGKRGGRECSPSSSIQSNGCSLCGCAVWGGRWGGRECLLS